MAIPFPTSGRSTAGRDTRPAGVPLLGIDAFTNERYRGNPAAVCLLDAPADEPWMQALATEMNVSETAFVVPDGDGFGLRWFTPTTEVVLCGHATLASAHALWQTGRLRPEQAAGFHTRWKGTLTATKARDGIALDFPAAPSWPCEEPVGLSDALGTSVIAVAKNDLHHIAEVDNEATVRNLEPDIDALTRVDVESVAVTSRSDDDRYDFVSRFFAPKYGINEDPVTGSAHTSLGPYWGARLGTFELSAYQASRRGGELRVQVRGDRVTLIGNAVTVWQGALD
jgi:predicted PhzF superfamily epimerase YddE/YHI9